jgi:hypothetical protein
LQLLDTSLDLPAERHLKLAKHGAVKALDDASGLRALTLVLT